MKISYQKSVTILSLFPPSFLLFWIKEKINKTPSLVIITSCPTWDNFFPPIKDFNIPFWSYVRD